MTKLGKASGPYAHAVISNNLVFVSGQLPLDPQSNLILNDFEAAINQVFSNLELVLKEYHSGINKIVKTTIYLKDQSNLDLEKFNQIYAAKFGGKYPARSLLVVSKLPKNALIMIDAIAEV